MEKFDLFYNMQVFQTLTQYLTFLQFLVEDVFFIKKNIPSKLYLQKFSLLFFIAYSFLENLNLRICNQNKNSLNYQIIKTCEIYFFKFKQFLLRNFKKLTEIGYYQLQIF